jgi:hypothetical protein
VVIVVFTVTFVLVSASSDGESSQVRHVNEACAAHQGVSRIESGSEAICRDGIVVDY